MQRRQLLMQGLHLLICFCFFALTYGSVQLRKLFRLLPYPPK